MRKFIVLLSVFAILGTFASAALAQPPAAAPPAPKVTINGLIDLLITKYHNWSGLTENDITQTRDSGFYSRQRFVPTITGEVGRTKGVLSLEVDIMNGCTGSGASCGAGAGTTTFSGTTNGSDLDTDVNSNNAGTGGALEVKWMYLETPIMGPGSIMPFIPVNTVVRGGLQPARGHEYKTGIHFGGDFPGFALESTWGPTLKSTLTYAQLREAIDRANGSFVTGGYTGESYAWLLSVEMGVTKALTVTPRYSYAFMDGGSGNASLGRPAVNGFQPNGTSAATKRHTIGGDVRWTAGPFTVQPTFLYQFGTQEFGHQATTGLGPGKDNVDIRAWIFDTTAGFRTGPLNIEGRLMYTPGMAANQFVQNGSDVGYYQSINPAFGYMGAWSEIQTSFIDSTTALFGASPGVSLRTAPSYDKYGRIFIAGVVDYSLTPALTFSFLANASWTDEKVDTAGVLAATGLSSPGRGDDRFLGVEVAPRVTYRFAPNVVLDLIGAYLFAGPALDQARAAAGPTFDAEDVWKLVSRLRFTF